jgi:CheY-like chemotaxis protein/signal transduction histidine kinase/HAMP domain-containing protein
MQLKDLPIQKKLLRVIFLISGVVLFVTCATFFVYEFYSFRQSSKEKLSTIGKIISTNSTAALAFESHDDAREILSALKAEPHIIAACLYDKDGKLFSQYPANYDINALPAKPEAQGYHFFSSHLEGFQPVVEGNQRLGTLYLKSDLGVMYERFKLYGITSAFVIIISLILSFILSRILQSSISNPILALAEIAKIISNQKDYSVRATKLGNDELGSLTDAFNEMLIQIQEQNQTLSEFNQKLEQRVLQRTNEIETVNKELKEKEKEQSQLVKQLQFSTVQIERKNNLLAGVAEMNNTLREIKDLNNLAQDIINKLVPYLNAQIGAIYLSEDNENIKWVAGYAFSKNEHDYPLIKYGEGLAGQAALQKKRILFTQVPPNYIKVNSALGEIQPKNILVLPFHYAGNLMGVAEIGSVYDFNEQQIEYIDLVADAIGIAFNSARSRTRMKDLLEETQAQSEELQTQQEELKQMNKELEEQAHSLKQQQEELQITNEELEEQTQSLETKNKEVEEAKFHIEQKTKQLEVSNKYKSEFLANMSHELRTPLNSLLILSKDLSENRKRNLSSEQVESAEIIYKSGHDLLMLINEILDLSKVEAGKMTVMIDKISLKDFMNDIFREFKHQSDQKKLLFSINIDKEAPEFIYSDSQRLNQILKNLMSNALKFTEKGKIDIKVERHNDKAIKITVADTGIGIPEEKQMAVFEAFQQADGGTSRKYGGTGLGLSISKELTKLLNGEIQLSSKVNEGSTFSIVIPIEMHPEAKVEIAAAAATKEKAVEKNSDFLNYQSIPDDRNNLQPNDKVVLIIEDDLKFSSVLLQQCNAKGFKCLAAASGEDGLVLTEKYKPKAIILDVELPGINGHQVLAELKANPAVRHIPVHIISGNDHSLEFIKEGAIECLMKPIDKQHLDDAFGRIESFVNRKMKNLLIVEDNENSRKAMQKIIGNGDVKCFEAGTGKDAIAIYTENEIDCIVLDIGLPDISGFELIRRFAKVKEHMPPIIIYTGKELTKEEAAELQKYAESIIIKGVKSEERLLDETALFLHRTISNLPESKQRIITNLYDKKTVFHSKKILVVDDDMRNIFALSKVLREQGMEVIKAENGKIALEVLTAEKHIDLILMDVMMPEMDGYEAMQKIRAQEKFKTMPIIALTAKAMKEDKQKCIDSGANDYITKPMDLDRLLSLIRVWLSK